MSAKVTGNIKIRTDFVNGLRNGGGYLEYAEETGIVYVFKSNGENMELSVEQATSLRDGLTELFTTMNQHGVPRHDK